MKFISREATVPHEAHDGYWWKVPAWVEADCPECGYDSAQPLVIRYRGDFDPGNEVAQSAPHWVLRGWQVAVRCYLCNVFWFDDALPQFATTVDIKRLVADRGGWNRHLEWELFGSTIVVYPSQSDRICWTGTTQDPRAEQQK